MNKHILLVMKWLNDKESVSQEELEKNRVEARAAYRVADRAATNACLAPPWSAWAAYWVNKYFKITNEDRNEYERELSK